MAIWCRRLAVDRWRHCEPCKQGQGADAHPLALIAETAHGPRIEAGNAAALALGIRPEMLLADARSLCPRWPRARQIRRATWPFSNGLRCGRSAGGRGARSIRLTGCWSMSPRSRISSAASRRCSRRRRQLFAQRGLAARIAIAPTAGAAWALAHFGPERAILGAEEPALRALEPLPVAALRLDADVLLVLRRLGLKRIGDLAEVGRDALQRRFRTRRAPAANPLVRLDQLLGRVPEPLLPVRRGGNAAGPAPADGADPPPRAARCGGGRSCGRHGAPARRTGGRAQGGSNSGCGGSMARC